MIMSPTLAVVPPTLTVGSRSTQQFIIIRFEIKKAKGGEKGKKKSGKREIKGGKREKGEEKKRSVVRPLSSTWETHVFTNWL